jgi:phosphopantothenoylcysteine decarboxylase/phosphopantothenate--cysteine ligase
VTLVTASPLELPPDVAAAITRVDVETAADMERAVEASAEGADVVVMAAAVADFRPKASADSKLSKEEGIPELVLEPTPGWLVVADRVRCSWASPRRRTMRWSGDGGSSNARGSTCSSLTM